MLATFSQFGRDTVVTGLSGDWPINACLATSRMVGFKANDGKPFELHTSYDDKEKYYRNLRNPWLFLLLMFALFAVTKQSIIFGIFALVSVIPGSIYQIQIMKIRKEAKTQEW